MINIHATTISFKNKGIMLIGECSAGKSDLALRMISQKKCHLVADDRTEIVVKNNKIIASCPQNIKNLMEVRGIGLVPIKCAKKAEIKLVVELVDSLDKIERMPTKEYFIFDEATVEKIKIYPFECSAPDKIVIKINSMLD